MNRRHLLATAVPLALAACGVATTTKTGTTTAVTVDTAKLAAWVDAIQAGAGGVLLILQAVPQTAAVAAVAGPLLTMIAADADALAKQTAGNAVLTFDAGSPPAALASLLADARTLVAAVQGVTLPPDVAAKVAPELAIVSAAVSAVQLAVGLMPPD